MSCKQSDRHCVDSGAGEDKMSPVKRLRCPVVGCNNEYIIRDPASPTEEVSIMVCNESLQIAKVLISKFHDECG